MPSIERIRPFDHEVLLTIDGPNTRRREDGFWVYPRTDGVDGFELVFSVYDPLDGLNAGARTFDELLELWSTVQQGHDPGLNQHTESAAITVSVNLVHRRWRVKGLGRTLVSTIVPLTFAECAPILNDPESDYSAILGPLARILPRSLVGRHDAEVGNTLLSNLVLEVSRAVGRWVEAQGACGIYLHRLDQGGHQLTRDRFDGRSSRGVFSWTSPLRSFHSFVNCVLLGRLIDGRSGHLDPEEHNQIVEHAERLRQFNVAHRFAEDALSDFTLNP